MRVVILAIALMAASLTTSEGAYNCGNYLKHYLGVAHHKCNLNLALEWSRCFSHTYAHPGAVVVQHRRGRALGGGPGGHVSVIKQMHTNCRALVHDNTGTYVRDICRGKAVYVLPSP